MAWQKASGRSKTLPKRTKGIENGVKGGKFLAVY